MFVEHRYTEPTTFLGRNGQFKAIGIEVGKLQAFETSPEEVQLSPITSKGDIGRCRICIPVAEIPAVIKVLERVINAPKSRE